MNFPTLTLLDFSPHSGDVGDRRLTLDSDGEITLTRKEHDGVPAARIQFLLDAEGLAMLGAFATTLAAQKREGS